MRPALVLIATAITTPSLAAEGVAGPNILFETERDASFDLAAWSSFIGQPIGAAPADFGGALTSSTAFEFASAAVGDTPPPGADPMADFTALGEAFRTLPLPSVRGPYIDELLSFDEVYGREPGSGSLGAPGGRGGGDDGGGGDPPHLVPVPGPAALAVGPLVALLGRRRRHERWRARLESTRAL